MEDRQADKLSPIRDFCARSSAVFSKFRILEPRSGLPRRNLRAKMLHNNTFITISAIYSPDVLIVELGLVYQAFDPVHAVLAVKI